MSTGIEHHVSVKTLIPISIEAAEKGTRSGLCQLTVAPSWWQGARWFAGLTVRHGDRESTSMNLLTNLAMLVKQLNGNHYTT
jgi:hypothetical protein